LFKVSSYFSGGKIMSKKKKTTIRISYQGEESAIFSETEKAGALTVTGNIVGEFGKGYDENITFHIPAEGEDLRLLRDPIFTWLLVNEKTGKAWINDMPWGQNDPKVPLPLKR